MGFREAYKAHVEERATLGVPPLPLTAEQTVEVIEFIKTGEYVEEMLDLLENRVSPGVDDAAYVKAAFLNEVASEEHHVASIPPEKLYKCLGLCLVGIMLSQWLTH